MPAIISQESVVEVRAAATSRTRPRINVPRFATPNSLLAYDKVSSTC